MTPSSYDIPLHDIKPLMEVPDSSFALLVIIVSVLLVLLLGALYLLYRFLRERQRVNLRTFHYRILHQIDFSDPKKAAYAITEHGRFFADDSERLGSAYKNLVERLDAYKYKKVVEPVDAECKSYFKIYLEMIDV